MSSWWFEIVTDAKRGAPVAGSASVAFCLPQPKSTPSSTPRKPTASRQRPWSTPGSCDYEAFSRSALPRVATIER